MPGKYDFAEQALRSRFLNAKEEIGTRAIQKGLSEILSMQVPPRVSEDEARIFEMLCCIMYSENRKWLSITQVALPYDQLVGDKAYREASLKSRVGLPVLENPGLPDGVTAMEQMQYRRRFLDLVSLCIPLEERRRYPHLLTLVDAHVVQTNAPPSQHSTGVDAGAWCIIQYLQTQMRNERNHASNGLSHGPDTPLNIVAQNYKTVRAKMASAIDQHAWIRAIAETQPSEDSLFAKILVHVALNRHCLETLAYQKRLDDLLPMQKRVFNEVRETMPNGLEEVVVRSTRNGIIDYRAVAEQALSRTMAELPGNLTPNVVARIERQVDAVLASARGDLFANEEPLNAFLSRYKMRAQVLLWIMLLWCYKHDFKILNEDPSVHEDRVQVVSAKSKLFDAGQDIATLRRMVSTPAFSMQWERPSSERLELYAQQNTAIRMMVQGRLNTILKPASLAQWDAAACTLGPKESIIEIFSRAEIGSFLREHGAQATSAAAT
jgi:hypothetical protein